MKTLQDVVTAMKECPKWHDLWDSATYAQALKIVAACNYRPLLDELTGSASQFSFCVCHADQTWVQKNLLPLAPTRALTGAMQHRIQYMKCRAARSANTTSDYGVLLHMRLSREVRTR